MLVVSGVSLSTCILNEERVLSPIRPLKYVVQTSPQSDLSVNLAGALP